MTNCGQWGRSVRERGSATGGAPNAGTPDCYMSRKSELVPRRALS